MSEGAAHRQSAARTVAGRYRLLRELGRGGMGTVWLADDPLVGRQVAVKELRPPLGLSGDELATFRQRAMQEANSAARIHHPNAVTLYDVLPATADADAIYLIMELIDGPTLTRLIQANGSLPDATVAAIGLQVLNVLQAAHALSIVHRDVKPANIMVTAGGQAKLTDFGIAHIAGEVRLTRSGVMGTQDYGAPELFESGAITPAADVWSLGATLYHAAEGHGPFDRDTTSATLRAILLDDLPVPRCSPALAAAITGMLQRDPARRATIEQARARLHPAATQATPPPRLATGTQPAAPPLLAGQPTAPTVPRQPTEPTTNRQPATGRQRATGFQPVTGRRRPTRQSPHWEDAKTTRAPMPPPVDAPSPAAADTAGRPRRLRLIIAVCAAAVIAIAGGSVAAILATSSGSALPTGVLAILRGESGGEINSVAFSSDGATIVTSDVKAGRAWVWSAATGRQVASLPASTINTPAAISREGSLLAYGTTLSQQPELWSITRRSPERGLPSAGSNVSPEDVAFSPDGSALAVGDRLNPKVYLYNLAHSTLTATLTDPEQPVLADGPGAIGSEVDSVVFSPNGKLLAAIDDYSGSVFVWNVATRKVLATLTLPEFNVVTCAPPSCPPAYSSGVPGWVAFSPDSGTLAIADQSQGTLLWNVATRKWGSPLPANAVHVQDAIAFSPDGKTLVTGDQFGSITLWNLTSHTVTGTMTEPDHKEVTAVAFSPDGKTLVTGDGNGSTYLWQVPAGG